MKATCIFIYFKRSKTQKGKEMQDTPHCHQQFQKANWPRAFFTDVLPCKLSEGHREEI